jgi:hypothetical protein
MQSFTDEQFDTLKTEKEAWYKTIGEISGGYFPGEKISFNAKGLEHLKFKTKNHARSKDDQYIRLKLLHLAPEVIKLSRTVQGISTQKVWEVSRSNQRNESCLMDAIFYEFVAVLEGVKVKVIIKKVGKGPKYFWSIIPNWKIGGNGKRKPIRGTQSKLNQVK